MSTTPRGHYDLTGWEPVNCYAADLIRRQGVALQVASSLTDPDGNYGAPLIFTEWWWQGTNFPALRDYRHPADHEKGCRHYVATGPEAAFIEDEEEQP